MSPTKLRELNLLSSEDLPYDVGIPYRDGVNIVYDGTDYAAVLRACVDLLPEAEIESLRRTEAAQGRRTGVGFAAFVEATGRGPAEVARVTLADSGRFLVEAASASAGQGQETTLAEVASRVLHAPVESIDVVLGDTARVDGGAGSIASRTAVVVGSAVHLAASALVDKALGRLAKALGVAADLLSCRSGAIIRGDSNEAFSWCTVLGLVGDRDAAGRLSLSCLEEFCPETVTWTMGVHGAVVSVDPETGIVRVLQYAVADEGGRSINHDVVHGQVSGGVAQGIGGSLLEEFRYDAIGQPLCTTLADYMLPTSLDVPHIRQAHIEHPSTRNPIGVKGIGESGVIASYGAIANALADTARDVGAHVTRMPIEPAVVSEWFDGANTAPGRAHHPER
jgi:carbon-monoxide dehydrogenase large subunit